VTNECRERITSLGEVEGGRVQIDPMVRVLGGQAVLSGDDDDGEEIEDVSPSLTSQGHLESGLI
jgi:homospermidine synthase